MAPYITPWSVMASAGISSSAARLTSAGMRLAPSSSEYSVWLCRWMKVFGACGIVWLWVWRTPGIVYLALSGAGDRRAEELPRRDQLAGRVAQATVVGDGQPDGERAGLP